MLTVEQRGLQERIANAKAELDLASAAYSELKRQCVKHEFVEQNKRSECAICGADGGWWCPESETHGCDYESDEYCIHCGAPEERK